MKIVQISNEDMKERILTNNLDNVYWCSNDMAKFYKVKWMQLDVVLDCLAHNKGAFLEVSDNDRAEE